MIWKFNEIAINFVRENTKILSMGDNNFLLNLNNCSDLITQYGNNFKSEKNYDLILSYYSSYSIDFIYDNLKIGGHILLEQNGIGEFNLENQIENFINNGFKIIKCNQYYDKTDKNYFYILAKKVAD